MKKIETKLKDCFIIEPNVYGDNRGWFMETYSDKNFEELGLDYDFVQDNQSYSAVKGTLRGLHFQTDPMSQAKLVRCSRGILLDVAVDIRKDSPTYKEWIAVELSADNKKQLMIPRGFAHGFLTLTDDVEIQYKADNLYSFEHDGGFLWNDPEIGVEWGIENPIVSEKDEKQPVLMESKANF